MNKYVYIGMLLFVGLISASSIQAQSFAQQDAWEDDEISRPGVERQDPKSSSLLWRPKQDSPEEQLAYAQDLEANGNLSRAAGQYNSLVHRWPESEEAPEAQFQYASLLMDRKKYEQAFKEFQYLIDHYPGLFEYETVLEKQFQIANALIGKRWGGLLFLPGFENPERAIPLLETLITNAPKWSRTPMVRLTIGMIHEESKNYIEAVAAYDNVILYHANRDEARQAAFRKAMILVKLSDRHPRDVQRCRAALSSLASFRARFAETGTASDEAAASKIEELKRRLEKMYYDRATFYDEVSKKPEAALISYQQFVTQFPASIWAEAAMQRIDELSTQQDEQEK